MPKILVVNAGSSSLKLALFGPKMAPLHAAAIAEVGGAARLQTGGTERACQARDHDAALALLLQELEHAGHSLATLDAASHRVVHGGRRLTRACRLTAETVAEIEALVPLAPLHNPANLAAMQALGRLAPGLPQFASFDTAFHATNPEVALRYAIPAEEDANGVRRFGFHGISYASLVQRLPQIAGTPLPRRLLALHLGNGASLCAIRDGRSLATTMGYSPLDGLTMGTRAGSIDGNAVLALAGRHGVEGAARLLNRTSGLLALGGASDMRALRAAGTAEAAFALEHFSYWAVRHAGAMIAAMGGLDAIAFTGGIGENDAETRASIMAGLDFLGLVADESANNAQGPRLHAETSRVQAWIVPAAEEAQIAAETAALLGNVL